MESLKSPIEITTVFFVLSIVFYVALFWWAQAKARAENQSTVRIPQRRASDRPLPQRPPPVVSIDSFEELALTRLFEDDSDSTNMTSH